MQPLLRTSRSDVSARKTYDLLDEPTGPDYAGLLECALVQCTTAVLTVPSSEMDPEGQATVESLARFQQAKSITAAGSLVRYALSRESVTVLQEATAGLYGWQHPGLPDNLCLYRGDGSPWLVSSAGAHIGYLEVSPFEKLLIGRTAPGLIAVLAHQSARDAILAYMERRFESNVTTLTEQLTDYARIVAGDGREGLVDALEDWMHSGEEARISAALEVARALRLVELRETVASMLRETTRDDASAPDVYRSVPALRSRWRIARRRQLERVLRQLS
ncbi:MAG: hypothetical protein WB808_05975 [Candidatus Dormiibacterota bacterium]